MCCKPNRSLFTFFLSFLLTTIVTACVKNGSKNEGTEVSPLITFEATSLSSAEIDGSSAFNILASSPTPYRKLEKTFDISVTDIREFTVSQGEISNKDCIAAGPFLYAFAITGGEWVDKPLRSNQKPLLLTPGQYSLKVTVENGSLCREVSMAVKMQSTARTDLTLTPQVDRGYSCKLIESRGQTLNQTQSIIQTQPLRIKQYQNLDVANYSEATLVDSETLCERELDASMVCTDSLAPAKADESPAYASQRRCTINDEPTQRSDASLQINQKDQATEILFNCRHKRKVLHLTMNQCDLLYDIGHPWPLKADVNHIELRRHRIQIGISPLENLSQPLPANVFVTLATQNSLGVYQPIVEKWHWVDSNQVSSGHFSIQETRLRRKVLEAGVENVKLVVSTRRNMRHGVLNISLLGFCSGPDNTIIEKRNTEANDLCEQFRR